MTETDSFQLQNQFLSTLKLTPRWIIRKLCLRRTKWMIALLLFISNLFLLEYIYKKNLVSKPDDHNQLQDYEGFENEYFPLTLRNKNQFNSTDAPNLLSFINSLEAKHGIQFEWIATRIRQDNTEWNTAYQLARNIDIFDKIKQKRILLYLGLMEIGMGKDALTGGPVGELVQWSNLISCLFLLQHQLDIVISRNDFYPIVKSKDFDLVFTDLIGINALPEALVFNLKCKFRILDSFGSEPEFNHRRFSDGIPGPWERWNFEDTRQMLTLFPHTPDNSFLGFMIPTHHRAKVKKNIAVIYGKEKSYVDFLSENQLVLKIVSEYLEIHTTMKESPDNLQFPVVNHGVKAYDELLDLLSESLLFIGLGFPYNGPGPLDAIAVGCVFLQPKFREGKNRWTDVFFEGKPTSLTYTSQHPYLEQFVGEPWVYTVDYANESALRMVVERVLNPSTASSHFYSPSAGYMPHEFTAVGFLERVSILMEKLVICEGGNLAFGRSPVVRVSAPDGNLMIEEKEQSIAARKVTDGAWQLDSCYHLRGDSGRHDVCIVLDRELLIWVWKVVVRLLPSWNQGLTRKISRGGVSMLSVSLLDAEGGELKCEKFRVDRLSYELLWINVSDVSEVCVSVEGDGDKGKFNQFVLCELEVYGEESYSRQWPSRSQLIPVVGERGVSCKYSCFSSGLICARNLFSALDTLSEIEESMGVECGGDMKIMNSGPGVEDTEHDRGNVACILNRDSMLYSCAAVSETVRRLCPCVPLHPGQNGLPMSKELSFFP